MAAIDPWAALPVRIHTRRRYARLHIVPLACRAICCTAIASAACAPAPSPRGGPANAEYPHRMATPTDRRGRLSPIEFPGGSPQSLPAIAAGDAGAARIVFRNASDEPQQINEIATSCGCVRAKLVSSTVMGPRAEGAVEVRYDVPDSGSGRIRHTLAIGAGGREPAVCELVLDVKRAFRIRPPHVTIGVLRPGQTHEGSVFVDAGGLNLGDGVRCRSLHGLLSARVHTPGASITEIHFEVCAGKPGAYRDTLLVDAVNLGGLHARCDVEWTVQPPVHVTPASAFWDSKSIEGRVRKEFTIEDDSGEGVIIEAMVFERSAIEIDFEGRAKDPGERRVRLGVIPQRGARGAGLRRHDVLVKTNHGEVMIALYFSP